jgi:uncharacterized repeat protein (TIGR01451 family)
VALLVVAFGVSTPAWAAPYPSAKYQTVPRPTPTSESNAVATATPRPDDDGEDTGTGTGTGGGSSSGAVDQGQREVPVYVVGETAAADDFTASVTSATLNVREGPGVGYAVAGVLSKGDIVDVRGRNADSTWLYVCCIPGTTTQGWASARLLHLDFDLAASADSIPVFGADNAVTASAASEVAAASATSAKLPVTLDITLSPPFPIQGQDATVSVTLVNPNKDDLLKIEVSDQLPPQLELVDVTATSRGTVVEQTSDDGLPIILAKWTIIPAGAEVGLTIEVRVADDVADGSVFDNLASVKGSNSSYASGAVTIGMPPSTLPDFQ